jgi:cyclic pyranopterin phosphate synthase
MCHGVALRFVDISYSLCEDEVTLRPRASATAETKVEREALTAISVAALTILICARLDKGIVIRYMQLERKRGGKGGEYPRPIGPGKRKI